jgi:hypothetical protein
LEVGRPVIEDVRAQLGTADDALSIHRSISELEIPAIATSAYRRIAVLARGGNEVHIVLSCPVALAFELGQAVGFNFKVIVHHLSYGRLVKVPPLTSEHLFSQVG